MDRRSNYQYPLRPNPQQKYTLDNDDDDDDDDDVILSTDDEQEDQDSDTYYDNDDGYSGPHNNRRKHPRIDGDDYPRFDPRGSIPTVDSSSGYWSEQATFLLLESWGDRFLQLGRCSLRSEDWNEVAERVCEATRLKLSVSDCRNRFNSLKLRYKKEKCRVDASVGGASKWVFFKKMDSLMTMSPRQLQQQEQCGLACGVDSGEFVFMNPRVYLDHSNALDEMRDSPRNSEDEEEDEEEEDEDSEEEGVVEEEESYKMLSESIKRVGEIYEKIEDSKREHMLELERMRGEFQRELELQKKEMIDRTTAEVAKLSRGDDEASACSPPNNVE